jgi:hypothetical protein
MSSDNTKRVTVVVTIVADRMVLPLMLVFKDQPNGCIARMEFTTYLTIHHY